MGAAGRSFAGRSTYRLCGRFASRGPSIIFNSSFFILNLRFRKGTAAARSRPRAESCSSTSQTRPLDCGLASVRMPVAIEMLAGKIGRAATGGPQPPGSGGPQLLCVAAPSAGCVPKTEKRICGFCKKPTRSSLKKKTFRIFRNVSSVEVAGVEPASKQGTRKLSTRLVAVSSFSPYPAGDCLIRGPVP